MNKKTLSQIFVLIALTAFAAFAIPNATTINDWLHSLSYTPSKEIEAIATDAGMSDHGKQLFYRHEPRLLNEASIKDHCGFNEVVLGCLNQDGIFIIDWENQTEYNRTLVTAVHEMLHVVFQRYYEDDSRLRSLLESQLLKTSSDIRDEVNSYSDPATRIDEAYAIIGSEVEKMSSDLETFYSDYFTERQKSVKAFQSSPEAD